MSNPRIAVVAIHGVGDHLPFEMASSVADMLEDLTDGPQQPRYCTFGETKIRLNVAPVKVEGHVFSHAAPHMAGAAVPEQGSWGPMGALYESQAGVGHPADAEPMSLDHLFMEGQLAQYKGEGPEDTYEGLRLEGKRYAHAAVGREQSDAADAAEPAPRHSPVPEVEVHVYDMFWSDLSGVSTAGLRIFGELYQLLFHLASIGVNNVKAAGIFFRGTPAQASWKRFNWTQVWAASMLAWPIPLLNLIILALAIGLFADCALVKLSGTEEFITTLVALLAVILGAWGFGLHRKGRFTAASFRFPVVAFLALAGIGAIAAILAAELWNTFDAHLEIREGVEAVAVALTLAPLAAGLWAVVCAYETRRPGTKKAFGWTLAAVIVAALLSIPLLPLPHPTSFLAMAISLRLIEVAFWILLFSWVVFWMAFVAAFATGYLAVRATGAAQPDESERARRTNWTARLTLALPSALFLLLSVAAWSGIVKTSRGLLPHHASIGPGNCPAASVRNVDSGKVNALCYAPFPGAQPVPASVWADEALYQAGLGYLPVLLLLTCCGAVIGIWGLLPSVLDEVSPPRGRGADSRKQSITLGNWLDHGFGFMRWAGRLLHLGIFLFPAGIVVAVLCAFYPANPFLAWCKASAAPFEKALGTVVAGAAVGVLGLGGRFSKLALGFRPIVRVALDVDNWMREHPRKWNPTARICGRYVSLLRFIAQWQGKDKRGYDALIVFAHSQGTVITADLLRFLNVEAKAAGSYGAYDGTLARFDEMPVYLFTMGCPLRQLYGLRFPYLYGYAPTGTESGPLPKPEDLGVCEWVNAYRTGDYVGRHLWRPHAWEPVGTISFSTWDPPQGIPKNIWTQGNRVEFSIGPGAHTHYWDSTAAAIAETLDILIARAKALPGGV